MTKQERYYVEALLKNYRPLMAKIEIEIYRSYPNYALKSLSIVLSGSGNTQGSTTEIMALENLSLPEPYESMGQVIMMVRGSLMHLNPVDRKIIKMRYFDKVSFQRISLELDMCQNTVIKKVYEQIFPLLIEVGILKAWEYFAREGGYSGSRKKQV